MRDHAKLTQGLKQTYDNTSLQGKLYIEESLKHYQTQFEQSLQTHNIASLAYSVMLHVDEAQAKNVNKNMVRCKKGCAFCCQINVDMTLAEALVIVDYCRENNITIDTDRLKIQQPLSIEMRPRHAQSGCIFLADDNTCKIYPARPLACRKYLVASDPKHCDVSKKLQRVSIIVENQTEILVSAFNSLDLEYSNMSAMVLKAIAEYDNF